MVRSEGSFNSAKIEAEEDEDEVEGEGEGEVEEGEEEESERIKKEVGHELVKHETEDDILVKV